jgi:hypothetical protein
VTDGDSSALTAHQHKALQALVTGASVTEAAAAAGVARGTVSRWINHDYDFHRALCELRSEIWNEVRDRLRAAQLTALSTLEARCSDPDEGLKAAVALVRIGGLDRLDLSVPGEYRTRGYDSRNRERADATLMSAMERLQGSQAETDTP